jgi:uncharacterized cupin superfamily protein
MTDTPKTKPRWTAAEIAATPEAHLRHPWNPNSEVFLRRLSAGAGLKRSVLTIARVPPGKESFVYHSHERDEEFLYILSGRGRAEIGDAVVEVGPGDFMGFTAPGVAHHLVNPYGEDLVYLMGGERSGMDIGNFPRLGRRIVFTESSINSVEDRALRPMTFADWVAKS